MAKSNYFNSRLITQTPDDLDTDVPWVIGNHAPYTERDILFTVNTSNGGERNRTWFIHFTNFAFDHTVPDTITGVEVVLKTRRNGRVYDETVCLSYAIEPISDNKTSYITDGYDHYPVNDTTKYGGEGDLWGGPTLSKNRVLDEHFGVTLRFQGHPYTPHKCGMGVESVQICFYS